MAVLRCSNSFVYTSIDPWRFYNVVITMYILLMIRGGSTM